MSIPLKRFPKELMTDPPKGGVNEKESKRFFNDSRHLKHNT
jgi:hypothetical protein